MWKVGDKLGRFLLEREIGQGSHGVVFAARDTALGAPVAVKILHPWLTQDTAVRDRFKRELLLARRISHPGVCRLFDLHEEGDAFFITMEYVEGQTLLNILKNEGRLQPLRAIKILRGVCQALAAAHQAGVIHRDLKPANIIVRQGDQPMILDFGTATAADVSRVTRPGTAVGSMRFISPEIFTGVAPSSRTDIYSLGVVAYVTLAGKLPYNAASGAIEMLDMIKNQPPQRLDVAQPDVPKGLADAIGRAMDKSPDTRFQSVLELDAALGAVEIQIEGPSKQDIARWAPAMPSAASFVHSPTTGSQPPPATTPESAAVETDPPHDQETQRIDPLDYMAAIAQVDAPAPTLVTEPPTFAPEPNLAPDQSATRVSPIQASIVVQPSAPTTMVDKVELTLGSIPPAEHTTTGSAFQSDHAGSAAASDGQGDAPSDGSAELPLITGSIGATEPAPEHAIEALLDSLQSPAEGPLTLDASQVQSIHDGTPATSEHTAVVKDFPFEQTTDVAPAPVSMDGPGSAPAPAPPLAPQPTLVVNRSDFESDEVSISRITGARSKRRAAIAIAALGAIGVVALIVVSIGGGDEATTADAGPQEDPEASVDAGHDPVASPDGGFPVGLVVDAGAEPVRDSGPPEEWVFDAGPPDPADGEGEVASEGEGETTPPPRDRQPPRRSPVDEGVRTAKAKLQQKGFIPGDIPAADNALKKAMAARNRPGDGMGHVRDATKAIDAQNIDRAFVMGKLARFNARFTAAKAKNPKLADRVEPLSRAAAEAFAKGQYPAANKKLNQGFAALK